MFLDKHLVVIFTFDNCRPTRQIIIAVNLYEQESPSFLGCEYYLQIKQCLYLSGLTNHNLISGWRFALLFREIKTFEKRLDTIPSSLSFCGNKSFSNSNLNVFSARTWHRQNFVDFLTKFKYWIQLYVPVLKGVWNKKIFQKNKILDHVLWLIFAWEKIRCLCWAFRDNKHLVLQQSLLSSYTIKCSIL